MIFLLFFFYLFIFFNMYLFIFLLFHTDLEIIMLNHYFFLQLKVDRYVNGSGGQITF